MRIILLVALAFGVSACAGARERIGLGVADSARKLPYKARTVRTDDSRVVNVTVVARDGASLDDLRESVRFQATRYCLFTFGASDADWKMDPATDDWAFTQNGETLTFEATCTAV